MTENNLKYLVRGHCPSVGFRYWYANSASSPFAQYPSDPYYPPLTPVNPYTDVVIFDIPRGAGSSGASVDGYVPFSTINPPAIGDLVFVDGYGFAEPALGRASESFQSRVIGLATKADSYRAIGVAPTINLETEVLPGDLLYLSSTLPGAATNIPPFSQDDVLLPVGVALTASSGGTCAVAIAVGTSTIIV